MNKKLTYIDQCLDDGTHGTVTIPGTFFREYCAICGEAV
jgi:hypothetical protein